MKRGQSSTEFLLVAGASVFGILLAVLFLYTKSHEATEDINLHQLNRIAAQIVDESEAIYRLGEPSKRTLVLTFPDGVTNGYVSEDQELVFCLREGGEAVFPLKVPLAISTALPQSGFTTGKKEFLLLARPNCVCMAQTDGDCADCTEGVFDESIC